VSKPANNAAVATDVDVGGFVSHAHIVDLVESIAALDVGANEVGDEVLW
jgi:hypothetical protein